MEIKQFDCAIFAAGTPVSKKTVERFLHEDLFVIAADAGYQNCLTCNIPVQLYVGDFDSAPCPDTKQEIVQLPTAKDDTDTANALKLAYERGYRNIVLFGALGGRIDHSYANLSLCALARERDFSVTIIDDHHIIFVLQDESCVLQPTTRYVSVFPFGGSCKLSLCNFEYPLEHYVLPKFCPLGVSNEIHKKNAEIILEEGMALVILADKN